MVDALAGTTSGVLRLHDGRLEPLGLERHSITAQLAGTERARVYRSPDGGHSWAQLEGITRSQATSSGSGRLGRHRPGC